MIPALAGLFLGAAAISDVTRRQRARILMGQWEKLFDELGFFKASKLLDHLYASGDIARYEAATRVFDPWSRSMVVGSARDEEEALVRAREWIGNNHVHVWTIVMVRDPDYDGFLGSKHPIAFPARAVPVRLSMSTYKDPLRELVTSIQPISPDIKLTVYPTFWFRVYLEMEP